MLANRARDRKCQILMIAPEPFFEPRGTPLSIFHRLEALSTLGHTVDLLTYPVGEDIFIKGVNIYRIMKLPFVSHVKIGPSWRKLLLDLFLFAKAISMLLRKRYDLIHSHEEASFFCALLAPLFRRKHLYDMHSSLPQQLKNFNSFNSWVFIKLFAWFERFAIHRSHVIITICPALQERVSQIDPTKKQMLIENTIDGHDSAIPETASHPQPILPSRFNGKRIVLYAGTFEPYQGLRLLVESGEEVVREFPDVMFLLVGGKPYQIAELRHLTQEKGLAEYFYFTGTVAPQSIPRFIEYADVLVSPRITGTNTPLKIYSYLRSGKPIVATDITSHTQVLTHDVSMLTRPTSEAFAQGLVTLLDNPEKGKELAERAKVLAERKYHPALFLKKMEATIHLLQAGQ